MNIRADREAFAVEMAKLGTAFSGGVQKATIALYWEYLNDLPIEAIRSATERIIKTRKYSSMPTVAEIRDAALGIDDSELLLEAERAWNRAVSLAGEMAYPYRGRVEMDNALERVVKQAFGGWRGLNESTNPEYRDRARFIDAFKAIERESRERNLLELELRKFRALGEGGER